MHFPTSIQSITSEQCADLIEQSTEEKRQHTGDLMVTWHDRGGAPFAIVQGSAGILLIGAELSSI